MPVVPRGAGTGLSGGANAVDGGIVVVTTGMDRIVDVDATNQVAVVQPGVITIDVDRAARAVGLSYPPDPSSHESCTIGGNIATNAGGLCCVKYGVTGDFVLGLEVVMADGRVVRTGRRTRKGGAGYDLTRLFVGSEGTLGLVTEATVRLRPAPPEPGTLVASFSKLDTAGQAIASIVRAVVPSRLELMDRTTLRAVEEWRPMGIDTDAEAMLLAQSDALEQDHELAAIASICREAGAEMVVRSSDPGEAETLMMARRLALPALQRQGDVMLDDVAVPIAELPELLRAIGAIAERRGVDVGTFGHAGDGNMHPTIVFDRTNPASMAAAREAFGDIVLEAIRLGGSITGEHGVGLLKRAFLRPEVGDDGIELQATIKHTLDPLGLLNPGKVL